MMEDWQLRLQIEVMAIMVSFEGMKAENMARRRKGQAEAYGEDAFFELADALDLRASQLRQRPLHTESK